MKKSIPLEAAREEATMSLMYTVLQSRRENVLNCETTCDAANTVVLEETSRAVMDNQNTIYSAFYSELSEKIKQMYKYLDVTTFPKLPVLINELFWLFWKGCTYRSFCLIILELDKAARTIKQLPSTKVYERMSGKTIRIGEEWE